MGDGLSRRPTAMEKRGDTSRRVKSNNRGRNRAWLDGLGRRPTAMGMRYDTAHSGTFKSEEETQASPRRAAQDEGRSCSWTDSDGDKVATKQAAGHCVEWLKDAAVGEARNR